MIALAVGVCVGLALLTLLLVLGSEKLLTVSRPPVRQTPTETGLSYEAVSFGTADGVCLCGWFFPLPGAPAIVYCPGRGAGLNTFDFRFAGLFHDGGYQVLMFDWRGLGHSQGRASMGYWEKLDLQGAVAYLRQRGYSGRMGAMGASLGAAVIYLAAGEIADLSAVAGDSGFASFEGMIASGMEAVYRIPRPAARALAWFLARLAAWRRRFPLQAADPVRAIGSISPRPVLIIHGAHDRHVPVAAAHALYQAAGEPKSLWIADVAHTEGLEKEPGEYRRRVLEFFDHWLKVGQC